MALVEAVATGSMDVRAAVDAMDSLAELDAVLHLSAYWVTVGKLASEWWTSRLAAGGQPAEVLEWARGRDLPDPILHVLAPDLAWAIRSQGSAPPSAESTAGPDGYLVLLLRLHAARFDFRPREMTRLLEEMPTAFRGRPAVSALQLFADLNGDDDERRRAAAAVVDDGRWRSWLTDQKLGHILLHGLWLAGDRPGNSARLIELGRWMEARFGGDSNLYYRLAWAFRVEGDLEAAKDAVGRAIDLLGPGRPDIHRDFARERELIHASMQIRAFVDHSLDEAQQVLREEGRRADRRVRDSLVGIIEVLGLFTTVIFFVLGMGTVAIRAESPAELTLYGGIIFVFVSALFLMFRLVGSIDATRIGRDSGRRTFLGARLRRSRAGAVPEE